MSTSTKELIDLQEQLASLIDIPESKWFTIKHDHTNVYTVQLQELNGKFEGWLLKNLQEEMTIDKASYSLSTKTFVYAIKKCAVWATFSDRENLQEFLTEADQRMDDLYDRFLVRRLPVPASGSAAELEKVVPSSKWCTITFDNIYQCYNVFPKISADFGEWLATHYRAKMAISVDGFCYESDMFFNAIENDNKWCGFVQLELLQEFLAAAELRLDELYARYQQELDEKAEKLPTSKWFTIKLDEYDVNDSYDVSPNVSTEFRVWLDKNIKEEMSIEIKHCILSSWCFVDAIKRKYVWCSFSDLEELQRFLAKAEPRLDELYARYQKELAPEPPTSEWFTIERDEDDCFSVMVKVSAEFGEWLLANYQDELDIDANGAVIESFKDAIKCENYVYAGFRNLEDLREFLAEVEPRMSKLYARYEVRGRREASRGLRPLAPAGDAQSRSSSGTCSAPNGSTELQEIPASEWLSVKYQDGTFEVRPNVQDPAFKKWLGENHNDKLNVRKFFTIGDRGLRCVNYFPWILNSDTCWFWFVGDQENLAKGLVKINECIKELYARYNVRGRREASRGDAQSRSSSGTCSAPESNTDFQEQSAVPTSKWFTIEQQRNSTFYVIPSVSTEFGTWLAANLYNEMDIVTSRWTLPPSSTLVNVLKAKTSGLFFRKLKRVHAYLAEADSRMDKLYIRFQEEQQRVLTSSKWFTVARTGITRAPDIPLYAVAPNTSKEFAEWLVNNIKQDDTWIGDESIWYSLKYKTSCYRDYKELPEFLAKADQRMSELYERYQAAEPLPSSKWFTVKRNGTNDAQDIAVSCYSVKPNVTDEFGKWLLACNDHGLIVTGCDADSSATMFRNCIEHGTWFGYDDLQVLVQDLARLDQHMDKLYERYQMLGSGDAIKNRTDLLLQEAEPLPTSKWFTVNYSHCYFVKLYVSDKFYQWLVKNIKMELDIEKPQWKTVTMSFVGRYGVVFSQLEYLREFLAEADQRMEKLYERYEEQAALPLSKWFTIQHNLCYDAELLVSAEFRHWLIANLTTELDMVLPLELPFQISSSKIVRCLTETGSAWFGIYKLQGLRMFLDEAEQRMDALYARYLAELVAPPPTSKWFTVENEFIYRVKLAVSDDFKQWLAKNCKDELDIDKCKWRTLTKLFVGGSGYASFSQLENVREFLAEADPRMEKLYERYQMRATSEAEDLHENKAKPPTSKWFTIDKTSFLYSVKPNVSAEFGQWLVANVEKIDLDIRKLHWGVCSGGFVTAIKENLDWINLYYRDLCEFLAEVEPRMEKLYELYQNELPTSKWFTVYRGSISYGHPILPTSVSPEFRQWLVKNHITELDIKTPHYTNAQVSTVSGGFFHTALKIGGDEMNKFFAEVDKRMDELYERFQAEQQEPWISIDRVEVVRVLVQAPRAFVNYCSSKTFAGVLLDWQANGKRQIQSEPSVWSSNMANLGCGLKKGTGICCLLEMIPRLQAALVEAHQAWQPDPEPGRLIIGKPPVEFEVGEPERGYKVCYHPSVGKPSEICDSVTLKKAITETVQVVTE